jgi:coenzyme F420-reducing hydrogenase delta subunit/Pyruvate/2-oxoacid:ferredoxin oxidoreductase delta subunit
VIGATLPGLVGAYQAARLGYRVVVLERQAAIAPMSWNVVPVDPLLGDLQSNPRVEFLLGADVEDVSGWCGDYTVQVTRNGIQEKIAVGGILLAAADDRSWAAALAPKLHVNLGEEGHIDTRNEITMATRTEVDGIFSIPPGQGEHALRSQVEAATAAISVLGSILNNNEILHPLRTTNVDRTLCGACGTCVKTCAFHACRIDPAERLSQIDERRCKACGNCVTACPANARDLATYPSDYITEAITIYARYERNGSPRVLCLLCDGCGYPAADAAGLQDQRYPASVLPIRVACGGQVDTQQILRAFRHDFDGVLIAVCREGHCHNIVGNVDMSRRVNLFRTVLDSRRLDPERLRIVEIAPFEGRKFAEEASRFVADLKTMETSGA